LLAGQSRTTSESISTKIHEQSILSRSILEIAQSDYSLFLFPINNALRHIQPVTENDIFEKNQVITIQSHQNEPFLAKHFANVYGKL